MQTIKFSTAVLVALRDTAKSQPSFSVHDITKRLRSLVNDGKIVLSDRTPEDVDGVHTFKVNHEEVKDVFNDLYATQVISLTRQSKGQYFEYSTPVSVASTNDAVAKISDATKQGQIGINSLTKTLNQFAKTPATAYPVTTQVVNMALVDYLMGRGKGSVVTMKQVQSRFDKVRGQSCSDYATLVDAHGFKVDKSNQYPSNWSVTV